MAKNLDDLKIKELEKNLEEFQIPIIMNYEYIKRDD